MQPGTSIPRPPLIRTGVALALVVAATVGLRSAYLAESAGTPEFRQPAVDALFHHYWARALATGDWSPPGDLEDPGVRDHAFLRPPGYPYLLAAVYRAAGVGPLAPRLVQMMLGVLCVLGLFTVGRAWLGAVAGLAAAAAAAVYWPLVYFEGELHAAGPLVASLVGVSLALLAWARHPRPGWAITAGVLLGAGSLLRPNVLMLIPFAAAWATWAVPLETTRRRRVLGAVLLGAAAAVVIAPAAVRNLRVTGRWIPITSSTGLNLYIGNNPDADGRVALELDGIGRFGTCFDYPALVRTLEVREGHQLDDRDVSRWFRDRALAWISAEPTAALWLTARKAWLYWGAVEVGHNRELELVREHSHVLAPLPGFSPLLGAAVVGLFGLTTARCRRTLTRPTARFGVWVVGAPLVLWASILPFFVAGRYRLAMAPFLCLLAGAAARCIRDALAGGRPGRATTIVAACVAVGLAHHLVPSAVTPDRAKWHYDRGTAWATAGRLDLAAHELRTAVALAPGYAGAWYNLGLAESYLGHSAAALEAWRRAVEIEPRMLEAWTNLGAELLRQGRIDEARTALEHALAIDPAHETARRNLELTATASGVGTVPR